MAAAKKWSVRADATLQRVEAALAPADRSAFRAAVTEANGAARLHDAMHLALRKIGTTERDARRIIASARVPPKGTIATAAWTKRMR